MQKEADWPPFLYLDSYTLALSLNRNLPAKELLMMGIQQHH